MSKGESPALAKNKLDHRYQRQNSESQSYFPPDLSRGRICSRAGTHPQVFIFYVTSLLHTVHRFLLLQSHKRCSTKAEIHQDQSSAIFVFNWNFFLSSSLLREKTVKLELGESWLCLESIHRWFFSRSHVYGSLGIPSK